MTKKARLKGLRRSEQLIGAGSHADAYAIGVIGPDPRRTDLLLVMIFAVAIALSFVFLGVIIIPGVLLVAAIHGAIDRPASVATTNQGVAVLARSELNGRPRSLLTVLPLGVLTDPSVRRSGSYVHLPNFELWFRKKEFERLLRGSRHQIGRHSEGRARACRNGNAGPKHSESSACIAQRRRSARSSPAPSAGAAPSSWQPNSESDVIYCSWCGKQRAVDAQSIHYCGSMERPSVYCMTCGTALEGAATCTSCGTPATKISR